MWNAFEKVCSIFWEIKKSENYVEIVEILLFSYLALGCNMSWKLHFLQSHLDFFPGNMAAVSDEHGERFRQDKYRMEKKDTVANGTQIGWLITAGRMYGRHQQKNTGDTRRQYKFLMLHLFLGRALYIRRYNYHDLNCI